MPRKSLQQIAAERPYPDYLPWWPMGEVFLRLMSWAILDTWVQLWGGSGSLETVDGWVADYLKIVYGVQVRRGLVEDFAARHRLAAIRSGEFDALSYGFYRSAFERVAEQARNDEDAAAGRRLFTRQVGSRFFVDLASHLALDLPSGLAGASDLARLQAEIGRIGAFLQDQGYLRDHFAFRFDVDVRHRGKPIHQAEEDVIGRLAERRVAYALYEMGYPVILPSAVYLFHTMGEAQHHSSRTIEELFARLGLQARETDDFDPSGYPSHLVVELWEIRVADPTT